MGVAEQEAGKCQRRLSWEKVGEPRSRPRCRGPGARAADARASQPAGKMCGAAAPSGGTPERNPVFRQPPAVRAAAASQRPAETNGAPERLTWSPLPLLEASNGHLAGTGWAWEALGRQEGVEVPGLGIRVGRRNNQMWEKRRKAEVKGSRAL